MDEQLIGEDEARFLKNYRLGINANANLPSGTGDGAPQGSNFGSATPLQASDLAAAGLVLPSGTNRCIGAYECQETNEIYWFVWNSNRQHGIYRVSGQDKKVDTVYQNPCLNFSIDPRYGLKNRVFLKVIYDDDLQDQRRIKAKYLLFTEGYNWQRWIDVETAIATKGFDPVLFPYFKGVPPHFDACDLINWIPTPPFTCPTTTLVPFTQTDVGKFNNLLYKSIQFAYQYIYTDGRTSVFSPYSGNVFVGTSSCSQTATNNPRCVRLLLDAGGPLVEKIRVFFRNCGGDWYQYDTLEKYNKCDAALPFYTRTIALAGHDVLTNTFPYTYCGDKECAIFSVEDAGRIQDDIPIKSFALTPVGNAVLLADNLYTYNNFPCQTLDNINVTVTQEPEDGPGNCTASNVTIVAYATSNGAPIAWQDKVGGLLLFGWPRFGSVFGATDPVNFDPGIETNFVNGQGFIGYLAGTPYATIGVQYRVDKDGLMEKVGILNYFDTNVQAAIRNTFLAGGYYVQRFEFVVPRGHYLFRIASNLSDILDPNYQQTSTYFAYRCNNVSMVPVVLFGTQFQSDNKDYTRKEIYINACQGNVDTFKDFNRTMLDTEIPSQVNNNQNKCFAGYVYDNHEVDNHPMELLSYLVDRGYEPTIRSGRYTDHNGFYFTSVADGASNSAQVEFWGEYECQMRTRETRIIETTSPSPRLRGQKFYKQDIFIIDASGSYKPCNEVKVKGRVTDENGGGIAGVNVVIERGGSTLTNSEGEFTLRVHKGNVRSANNPDLILFGSSSACPLVGIDCGCTPTEQYLQPPSNCSCTGDRIYPVTLQIRMLYVNTANRGLKGGGRYGMAIVGRDRGGRQTFANNFGYVDIPTFLQTGVFTPSQLNWSVTPSFTLPPEISYISIYRTKNLNFGSFIQWVGDKIQYLNARGETITTVDEAVRARITIQSLLDFNKENNFATTVGYQFVQGDMLRIYDDGDGNLFRVDSDNPYMDYQILGSNFNESISGQDINNPTPDIQDGRSFIIGYDKRLEKLKDKCSFWIEIIRPHLCQERELYFEICGTYAVENGKLLGDVTGGTLSTWDTYYQTRFIRPKDCAAKQFNHPFESASITDFWGVDCDSSGRITIADPDAFQQWYADDVIKSDDSVNEGRVNGLGTFREKNRKSFMGQEWGGIVAMHAERSIVAFVCQNDWFLTDFNMNYIRASDNGGLVVVNLSNALSEPHQKVGYTYGCEFEDNASIIFDDGIVIWADRKNANIVVMDYRSADDVAQVDNKSYFVSKFRHVIQFNNSLSSDDYLNNLIEITGAKDPKYNEYLISFRPRAQMTDDASAFNNTLRETSIDAPETFVFNLDQKKWVRFAGYVPEQYGVLRHSITGIELIAFCSGLPYFMNNNAVTEFNTFFGVESDQVISVIMNFDNSKVKIFQSLTVESQVLPYFVDLLFTDETNSYSYVPLNYWKSKEGIWYTEVLRDMNSYQPLEDPAKFPPMLIDGKRVFGQFAYLRLVRDTRFRRMYNEFNNFWVRITASERSEK